MCLAIPGKVIELQGEHSLERVGRIDFNGILRDVSVACTPEVKVGDYVLVHAGFSLSIVDEAEALALLATFADEVVHELSPESPT